MPALVITAVDNTTDTLTSVAHGQNTGDGAAAIFALAGGVIPTGLAGVTDYWIIRVDADHVKLASSSANALANVPVNITSNGTLPLSLGIGIPYRRARTYAALSQVKSVDLDSFQDVLTALWNLLTGQAQSLWTTVTLAVGLVLGANQHITLSGTGRYKRGSLARKIPSCAGNYNASNGFAPGSWTPAALNGQLAIPLDLFDGERLLSAAFEVKCGATDVITCTVFRIDAAAGTNTSLGSAVSVGHASALETVTVTLGTPETCSTANGYSYVLHCQATTFATGGLVYSAWPTTDVP